MSYMLYKYGNKDQRCYTVPAPSIWAAVKTKLLQGIEGFLDQSPTEVEQYQSNIGLLSTLDRKLLYEPLLLLKSQFSLPRDVNFVFDWSLWFPCFGFSTIDKQVQKGLAMFHCTSNKYMGVAVETKIIQSNKSFWSTYITGKTPGNTKLASASTSYKYRDSTSPVTCSSSIAYQETDG